MAKFEIPESPKDSYLDLNDLKRFRYYEYFT